MSSAKRRQALLGSNLPRDSRILRRIESVKPGSIGPGFTDFSTIHCRPCLENPGVWGRAPAQEVIHLSFSFSGGLVASGLSKKFGPVHQLAVMVLSTRES